MFFISLCIFLESTRQFVEETKDILCEAHNLIIFMGSCATGVLCEALNYKMED